MVSYNKNSYKNYLNDLFKQSDLKYREFYFKLLNSNEIRLIGIRTPILKKEAKKIAKNDYLSFIKFNNHHYFEETLLHGLIITYLNNFEEAIKLFDNYINYIDNWATCDIVVSNFKLFKKNQEKGINKIKEYLNSSKPFINRVGLVLLLNYYINDQYIDLIFDLSKNVKNDNYYVKMANAWLISYCLIKYKNKTIEFLKNNYLDKFTHNKAIQKSIESYRITNKDELKKLKRN